MAIFSSDELRAIRKRARLNTVEMGKLIGVNPQSVSNWENKRGQPSELHSLSYYKLKEKLKNARAREINKEIKMILITGGVLAFMAYLFKDD